MFSDKLMKKNVSTMLQTRTHMCWIVHKYSTYMNFKEDENWSNRQT